MKMSEESWRHYNALILCNHCKKYLPLHLFQEKEHTLCLQCARTLAEEATETHYTSGINPHYYKKGKIEVIDFIEDQELEFHLANVIKYLCRNGKAKSIEERVQDLEKALWYLKRYIDWITRKSIEKKNSMKDALITRINEEGYTE